MRKILLLLIILLFIPTTFAALSRSFNPATVTPGGNVVVTLTGGEGFTGIIEQLPSGFTLVSGDNANQQGNEVRAYFTASTYTYTVSASTSTGSHSFSGTYEGTGGASGTIGGATTVTVTSGGCTDTSWTPSTSTVCSGESFTQTSNCGTTRTATGTKTCSGGLVLTRSFSPISPAISSQVIVTLSGGEGFTGIIEQLPSGFTLVSGENIQQVGNELRAYFTGSTYSYILSTPPTTGTYTFSGTCEGTGGIIGTITGTNSLIVQQQNADCGNGFCDSTENNLNCPQDCPLTIECGNGIIETGEDCDGTNLDNENCITQGFDDGQLDCYTNCKFDKTACIMNEQSSQCLPYIQEEVGGECVWTKDAKTILLILGAIVALGFVKQLL